MAYLNELNKNMMMLETSWFQATSKGMVEI